MDEYPWQPRNRVRCGIDRGTRDHPETTATARRSDLAALAVWALLGGYFLAQAFTRLLSPHALEVDEAEQLLLWQWPALGYGAQPPLYTWLQSAFFDLLGPNVAALTLLKNAVLFVTFAGLVELGRQALGSNRAGLAAAALAFLLPQVAWEAQRDQSNSVLAMACAVGTLVLWERLTRRDSLGLRSALGICLGAGILAKYNFLVFTAAFGAAALSLPSYRRMLVRPASISIAAAALVVVMPHLVWVLHHRHSVAAAVSDELNPVPVGDYLQGLGIGLWSLLKAIVSILGPLGVFAAWCRWRGGGPQRPPSTFEQLLGRGMLASLVLLGLLIAVGAADTVNPRWLEPLLIATPVWLLLNLSRRGTTSVPAWSTGFGLGTAGLALTVMFLRNTAVAAWLGDEARIRAPYPEIVARLRSRRYVPATVITDDHAIGGNLKLQCPTCRVYSLDLRPIDVAPARPLLVVWQDTGSENPPAAIQAWLQRYIADPAHPPEQFSWSIPYPEDSQHLALRFAYFAVPGAKQSLLRGRCKTTLDEVRSEPPGVRRLIQPLTQWNAQAPVPAPHVPTLSLDVAGF